MAMVVGVGFDLDLVVVAAAAAGVAGLLVEVKVALVFGSTTFWRETAHNIISGNVDTIRRGWSTSDNTCGFSGNVVSRVPCMYHSKYQYVPQAPSTTIIQHRHYHEP